MAQPNAASQIADALTEHQIDLLRLAAKKTNDVYAQLNLLENELITRIKGRALSDASRDRMQAILDSVRKEIKTVYSDIRDNFAAKMRAFVKTEADITAGIVNKVTGIDIYTGVLPRSVVNRLMANTMIQGAPQEEWWSRQAGDLSFRFSTTLRSGIIAGETNAELITRVLGTDTVPGVMAVPRQAAAALVQTSVQTFANQSRLESFKENADVIKGVQQVSTLDERTSDVCIAYDGSAWNLDGEVLAGTDTTLPFNGGPPRHWNCRSILIPITKTWRDLGVNIDEIKTLTRASMDGQVAATTTFSDWLETKTEEQQNEILGEGKAALWRDGKITLRQLLDQRGNPLSLQQLQTKYGSA